MKRKASQDFDKGNVLVGFGLANAGRYYTVEGVSSSTSYRVQLREHLTERLFWTFAGMERGYYRLDDQA